MFDKIAKSKTLKFVLFITAFAFVGTGLVALIVYKIAGGAFTGAAVVNGNEISFQALQQEYNNLARNMEEKGIDTAPMRKLLYQQALENLIARELLYQQAEKEGIVATKEEVKKAILNYKAFYENGKFSKDKYVSVLRSAGLSPEIFEDIIRKDLTTKHIVTLLKGSFYITDDEIDSFIVKQLTKVSGDVYIIPVKVEISDEEVKKYYEKNKNRFTGEKGKRVIIYEIDVKKLGKEKAQKVVKDLYSKLKEGKDVDTQDGVSKLFEGVVYLDKKNEKIKENIIKELKQLSKERNIALVKEESYMYLVKYLGEYSKPLPVEKVKNKIIAVLSIEKRQEKSKELLKAIKEEIKKGNVEKVLEKYNAKQEKIERETLQIVSAKYGISKEALKSIFKTKEGSFTEPFISRRGIVLIKLRKKEFPSKEEIKKSRDSLYKLVEEEKFNTYIQMYIDKLKKESDIRINPRVIQ